MKRTLITIAAIALAIGLTVGTIYAQDPGSNYNEQGGKRTVIGGSLDVVSGGDVDFESGAALKIGGVAVTATAAELNISDGVTSTAAELNILDGVTSTAAELNILDGVTATAAELNVLDDALTRADFVQQDLQVYPVTIAMCRVWDNLASLLPTAAATDDLGIVEGTWLTDDAVIQTSDGKVATTTQRLRFQYPLPVEYVAGETVTLRINAGMITTVSDTTATIDVEAIEVGTPASDICATAAVTINSLTPANVDFTITPTSLAPGDVLDVRVTIAITDGATGTAVIGQINTRSLLLDVKG